MIGIIDPNGSAFSIAWCKGCQRGTPSVTCPQCGIERQACAVCLRCPPCDGPIEDEP